MIGAFARMIGNRQRVLSVEETEENGYAVQATGDDYHATSQEGDQPPEAFVQRFRHEGGDVWVAPMVEMLRELLRRRRAGAPVEENAEPEAANL